MNYCAIQKNAFAAIDEMRSPFAFGSGSSETKNPVLCPKPRRPQPVPAAPFRCHSSYQVDACCDAKAGTELLDIFLSEGGEQDFVDSSIPFFSGSPPSRPTINPVIHDARFHENRLPIAYRHNPLQLTDPISPILPRKSCSDAKYGLMPAAVLIEGFNCLDSDRRNSSSITAVA